MELYHHGVKGQRWGVRRYQNKDGTLNAAGLKRLQKLENKKENLQKMLNENHSRVSSTREKYADASEKYRQAKGLGKLKAGWNKLVAYDKYMGARERRVEESHEIQYQIASIISKQEKMAMNDIRAKDTSSAKEYLKKYNSTELGKLSNRLTDMTLKGASKDEIESVIRKVKL